MSFTTSSLKPTGSEPTNNPEQFGERLRSNRGSLTTPLARLWEKFTAIGRTIDPATPSIPPFQGHFNLLIKRISKTVKRVTLLENLHNPLTLKENGVERPLTVDEIVGDNKAQRDLLEKICPGVLKASPLVQQRLIEQALAYQKNKLDRLLKQVIQWTFLQPDAQNLSQNEIFEMLAQVQGTLTSQIKWITDPYIPFLKMAIAERAKWHVRSLNFTEENPLGRLFVALTSEQYQIFCKVPEGYYNNFLGATHEKVSENLRNGNDKSKINNDDIIMRIIELQLRAVVDFLMPDSKKDEAYQLLLKLYNNPAASGSLTEQEQELHSQIIQNGVDFTKSKRKIVSLQQFVTHPPKNAEAHSEINNDLKVYQATTQLLTTMKESAKHFETKQDKAIYEELRSRVREIARLTGQYNESKAQQKKLEQQLARYPEGLEDKAVKLQAHVWKLDAEIKKVDRVTKERLQQSYQSTNDLLQQTIDLTIQQLVTREQHKQCLDSAKEALEGIASQRRKLAETQEKLVQGRVEYKEVTKIVARQLKMELQELAAKVYYLTPDQIEDLKKDNGTEWVMIDQINI